MYPKMWVACGRAYPELIDRFDPAGIERHEKEAKSVQR